MRKRLICWALTLCLLAGAAWAEETEQGATEAESAQADADVDALLADVTATVESKLERVLRRYAAMGACVCVIENGAVSYTYCYGTARNGNTPITPDTCFQVGSISKLVSAIGLMRLVEQGKATLEDELGALLGFEVRNPAYPDTPVTLRQLLTHTAGLRNSGDYTQALSGDVLPLPQALGQRAGYAFMAQTEPGSRREYCNFGGGLAGSLIERLSGQKLDEYMTANVFAPLGITAAYQPGLLPKGTPIANLYAMPERRLTKQLIDEPAMPEGDWERDYVFTAGKLTISAPDLSKLMIVLCDGGICGDARILGESTVQEMLTPQNNRLSVACESGNGLFVNIITDDQVQGRVMYGHGGKANGMLCAAYVDPTDRTGVVMLTNGCYNKSSRNGVGMLGRAVMRVIYQDMLADVHEVVDPFLVEE